MILAVALEDHLVFRPVKYPGGNWATGPLAIEDVFLNSADGTRIHGWYLPHEDLIATVLFLHGNDGNVTDWYAQLWNLHHSTGVSVLAIDYRGYGKSEGRPSEAGLLMDACAARDWLAKKEAIHRNEVVLMGRSLGGGIAVQLAADTQPRALVLERTFTSLPDAAGACYPFLPTRWFMRNRFDSQSAVANYLGPLLQSHGTADRIVPYGQAQRLFALAPGRKKQFISVAGGGHHSPQPDGYYRRVREFLLSVDAADRAASGD